jgi:hypothetical protein
MFGVRPVRPASVERFVNDIVYVVDEEPQFLLEDPPGSRKETTKQKEQKACEDTKRPIRRGMPQALLYDEDEDAFYLGNPIDRTVANMVLTGELNQTF